MVGLRVFCFILISLCSSLVLANPCSTLLARLVRDPMGTTEAFNRDGSVVFKGQPYRGLRVHWDPDMATVRYTSQRGRIPEGTRVALPLFHGTGEIRSHSGAMLSALNILSDLAVPGDPSATRGLEPAIRSQVLPEVNRFKPFRMAAEAIDFPGHGAGPDVDRFPTLESVLEWVETEIRDLKKNGVKVIPIARSGTAGVLCAFNLRHPGLLDGLILISPLNPVPERGLNWSIQDALKVESEGGITLNHTSFSWVNRIYREMDWHFKEHPFGNTPTLVLMGGRDPETSVEARQDFARYVRQGDPRSVFLEIPTAGHDVLATRDKTNAIQAYSEILKFIGGLAPGIAE